MFGKVQTSVRSSRSAVRGIVTREDIDFDALWESLESALREIHTKNASQLSFETLYRTAYKLVLKKRGETLYERVKQFEREWLVQEVQPRIHGAISTCLLPETTEAGMVSNITDIENRTAGEKLMKALKYVWEDHILCMNMTTDILMYMDRVYCTDNRKASIFTAAMMQFRDCVLRTSIPNGLTKISSLLFKVILNQIQTERDGDVIDQALTKSCVYMLEGLYEWEDENESQKLYLTDFEPEYLLASKNFYRLEGQILLRDGDAGNFCRQAKKRLDEEADRCRSTLSPLTLPKIKAVVENELIKVYIKDVIEFPNSGVKFMLDNDRMHDLGMIYDLVSRVDPKKTDLVETFQQHVAELGSEVNNSAVSMCSLEKESKADVDKREGEIKSSADNDKRESSPSAENGKGEGDLSADKSEGTSKPSGEKSANLQTAAAIKWVDDVLNLKEKFDKIVDKAFHGDQDFVAALGRSLAESINAFERASEFLSLFFDENMKKGIKGRTEHEVDCLIDKGIVMLRYIKDKDMFEQYYKKHLARRLLMKRSISMDAERQMISRMKMEVGRTQTGKIESMFNDMVVSEELTREYRTYIAGLGDPDPKRPDIEVNILTTTMWPLESMSPSYSHAPGPTCVFPPSIETVKQGLEKFYLGQHVGRQLTWQPSMGTADIRAYFPKSKGKIKIRELNVSTYAMMILLLFNDLPSGGFYTCEEIQAKTNIPMNELSRNLQSLAVATKSRVLIKEPMSKDVKPTDKLYFNEGFSSPYAKVKIGVVSANKVENTRERMDTEKRINESRGGIIEAAIVRIMKQRKTLTHQKLIAETIQQLSARFQPDINMIKKRVESLIEREYLEREEDAELPSYRYLA